MSIKKSFDEVLIRQFGAPSSNQWDGPIYLTLQGKNISWVYGAPQQTPTPGDEGEILRWAYGDSCRSVRSFSNPFGSKEYRIDISLKVPGGAGDVDPNVGAERGKPYAFAFKSKDDFDAITSFLKTNIGAENKTPYACNLSTMGYGKDGFEKFKSDSLRRGGKRKRKSKTKRKTTKRKKIQKKRKSRRSSKRR